MWRLLKHLFLFHSHPIRAYKTKQSWQITISSPLFLISGKNSQLSNSHTVSEIKFKNVIIIFITTLLTKCSKFQYCLGGPAHVTTSPITLILPFYSSLFNAWLDPSYVQKGSQCENEFLMLVPHPFQF